MKKRRRGNFLYLPIAYRIAGVKRAKEELAVIRSEREGGWLESMASHRTEQTFAFGYLTPEKEEQRTCSRIIL
jgi:hypothetical protein